MDVEGACCIYSGQQVLTVATVFVLSTKSMALWRELASFQKIVVLPASGFARVLLTPRLGICESEVLFEPHETKKRVKGQNLRVKGKHGETMIRCES